ncbi:MAG: dethiobiotin synthase [Methylococcales bacterium]|nr:dethiobiotin synthase [Methylococcales bacterium]
MKQGFFITGTDTNVGKTWATIALIRYFKKLGKVVVGMKPVAAGCELNNRNEDALLIQTNASVQVPYDLINPYAYEQAVSPHIAGINNPVEFGKVIECYAALKEMADVVIVEGAGGWYAPLNAQQDISDLAITLGLPIILVVGIKLGCINHAKLTYQAIKQSGTICVGWIAVCVDADMLNTDENIDTIKHLMPVPLLGVLPHTPKADFDFLAEKIEII